MWSCKCERTLTSQTIKKGKRMGAGLGQRVADTIQKCAILCAEVNECRTWAFHFNKPTCILSEFNEAFKDTDEQVIAGTGGVDPFEAGNSGKAFAHSSCLRQGNFLLLSRQVPNIGATVLSETTWSISALFFSPAEQYISSTLWPSTKKDFTERMLR